MRMRKWWVWTRPELKFSVLRMLLVHAVIAMVASGDGGNFATNLPFMVVETEGPSISVLGSKVVLSVTPCCPSSQMMAACCSLYTPPETVSTVNIKSYLDSQGESSKIGYSVQLPHSKSLLGLPSAPKFILNGPHADQSLGTIYISMDVHYLRHTRARALKHALSTVRDILAFNISRATGM